MPMIEVRELVKSFGALDVLKGVSFGVEKGEVVVVLGPSGSGKSTMLRCINLLEDYRGRRDQHRRRCDRLPHRRQGAAPGWPEAEKAQAARAGRHGVPELQPVPAPHGA